MRAETEAALVETGLSWTLQYFPSLELDEESAACGMAPPRDHWSLTLFVSLEEDAEGWGGSSDAAALDALAKLEAMEGAALGDGLAEAPTEPQAHMKWRN